jgi:hypothetical protein
MGKGDRKPCEVCVDSFRNERDRECAVSDGCRKMAGADNKELWKGCEAPTERALGVPPAGRAYGRRGWKRLPRSSDQDPEDSCRAVKAFEAEGRSGGLT